MNKLFEKIHTLFSFRRCKPVVKEATPLQAPSKKETHVITVGLDFGTSSVKAIWNDYSRNKHYLAAIDLPVKGYPSFCMPSSIKMAGGKIYFGADAENAKISGQIIHSIKTFVGAALKSSGRSDDGQQTISADTHLCLEAGSELVIKATPRYLAILLLANVISRIRKCIESHYGDRYELSITFNMAAPIGDLDHPEIEHSWQRILFLAEKLSEQIQSGMPLLAALQAVHEAVETHPHLPDPAERCTFVLPEALAAVLSYFKSGKAVNGLYGIVDIGAGTTDISVFRYYAQSLDLRESIYAGKSYRIGMDDFDQEILKLFSEELSQRSSQANSDAGDLQHDIRCAKLALESTGHLEIPSIHKSKTLPQIAGATQNLRSEIYRCYKRTLGLAYKKEARQKAWEDWTLFLIGGGSRLNMMQREFQQILEGQVKRPNIKSIALEGLVGDSGGNNLTWNEEMTALFAISYGLSFSQMDWPEWWYPKDVAPLSLSKPSGNRPDQDELYPK